MLKKFLIALLIIVSGFLFYLSVKRDMSVEKDQATLLYENGIKKIEEKDYQGAIDLFTQVIEINPEHDRAYGKRGAVKAEFLKQHKEAIVDLDKAIELNPKNALAFHNRGLCKINIQDLEAAVQDFSQAIKISPTYYIAHNSRGAAYGMLGEYEKALKDFESVIIIKPDYFNAHLNKIYALIKMKKHDEAMKSVEEARNVITEANSEDHKRLDYMIRQIETSKKFTSMQAK